MSLFVTITYLNALFIMAMRICSQCFREFIVTPINDVLSLFLALLHTSPNHTATNASEKESIELYFIQHSSLSEEGIKRSIHSYFFPYSHFLHHIKTFTAINKVTVFYLIIEINQSIAILFFTFRILLFIVIVIFCCIFIHVICLL